MLHEKQGKCYSSNASLQNEHTTKIIFLSSYHSTPCVICGKLFFILHAMFFGVFLIFWSGMKISLDVDAEEKNMVNTLSRFVMLNKNNSVAVHKFLVEYLHRY